MKEKSNLDNSAKKLDRRTFIRTSSVGATGLALGGLGISSKVFSSNKTFTLGTWGGIWEKTFKQKIVPRFEKEFNVRVIYDVSSTTQRVAKINASKDNQVLDFAMLTPEGMVNAIDSGLLDPVNTSIVTNFKDVSSGFRDGFDKNGKHYGAAISWSSTGILWRKDLIPFKITKFTDLWHRGLEDRISIQNMPSLGGSSMLIASSIVHGGSQYNLDPGWRALKLLRPNIQSFFRLSSEVLNRLVTGEVWAAVSIAGQGVKYKNEGVAITTPSEGTTFSLQGMGIPVNTKNYEMANNFMNFCLRPDIQAEWTASTNVAPTNEKTILPSGVQNRLVEKPETVKKLFEIDFRNMAKNKQDWTERWLQEVAI